MSINDPEWVGERDGQFRGTHLRWCREHPGVWFSEKIDCPICSRDMRIRILEEQIKTYKRELKGI